MENFQTSGEIIEIAKALLLFQKKNISVIKNTENKFLKNKYADLGAYLDVLMPAITECGLVLTQIVSNNELITQVIHAESGQYFRSSVTMIFSSKTSQEIGSQISYFRRYTISAMFSLYAEDDDANSISGVVSEKPTKWLNMNSPEWKTINSDYTSIVAVKKDFLISKSVESELEKIFN